MQYVRMRVKKEEVELFEGNAENETDIPTITHEQYTEITDYLRKKRNPALLPVQIAFLQPYIQHFPQRDIFRLCHKLLFLVILHCLAEKFLRF